MCNLWNWLSLGGIFICTDKLAGSIWYAGEKKSNYLQNCNTPYIMSSTHVVIHYKFIQCKDINLTCLHVTHKYEQWKMNCVCILNTPPRYVHTVLLVFIIFWVFMFSTDHIFPPLLLNTHIMKLYVLQIKSHIKSYQRAKQNSKRKKINTKIKNRCHTSYNIRSKLLNVIRKSKWWGS